MNKTLIPYVFTQFQVVRLKTNKLRDQMSRDHLKFVFMMYIASI